MTILTPKYERHKQKVSSVRRRHWKYKIEKKLKDENGESKNESHFGIYRIPIVTMEHAEIAHGTTVGLSVHFDRHYKLL